MFSERLKSLRRLMGITQEELSKGIGVQRAAISKYESGLSTPSIEVLMDIANYFDTTVDYLLGRTDDPENSDRFGLEDPVENEAKKLKFVPSADADQEFPQEFIVDPETENSEFIKLQESIKNNTASKKDIIRFAKMSEERSLAFYSFVLERPEVKKLMEAAKGASKEDVERATRIIEALKESEAPT